MYQKERVNNKMTKSSEIIELLKKGIKQKDIVDRLKVDKGLVSRLNHKLKIESKSIGQPVDSTSQPVQSTKNPEAQINDNKDSRMDQSVDSISQPVQSTKNLDHNKTPINPGPIKKIQIKSEIRHLVNLLGVNSKFYRKEGFKGTLEIRERISLLLDQL